MTTFVGMSFRAALPEMIRITSTSGRRLILAAWLLILLCVSCQTDRASSGTPELPGATVGAETPSITAPTPTTVALTQSATDVQPSPSPTETIAATPIPIRTVTPIPTLELPSISAGNVSSIIPLAQFGSPGIYFSSFDPTGFRLATASQVAIDRSWSVQLWDLPTGQVLSELSGGPRFSFGPEGRTITIANSEGGLAVWEVIGGPALRTMATDPLLALSADSSLGLVLSDYQQSSDRSSLSLISALDGSIMQGFSLDGTPVAGLFSPSGHLLAISTGGTTSETTLWDTASGQLIHTIPEIDRLAFSPGGRYLAALFTLESVVRIIDLADWTNYSEMRLDRYGLPQKLLFSPDGGLLAGALGYTILFWDAESGRLAGDLDYQAGDLDFSPDGRMLSTVDFGSGVTLWGIP